MMAVLPQSEDTMLSFLSWLNGRPARIFSLLLLCGFSSGCKAQEAAVSEPSSVLPFPLALPELLPEPVAVLPTHRFVQAPPPAGQEGMPLWVALEDHLGQGTTASTSGHALRLLSAGQPLVLRDGSGREYRGTDVMISWRLVPLALPQQLAREQAGPFASFESAERVAIAWGELGVDAVVAHPGDWQVWAPLGSSTPKGVISKTWRQTVSSTVEPVFQASEGGHTLTGPVQIEAPDGLHWRGGLYKGPFRLQADAYGSWTLLEQVPLERYLEGVVPHEIGAGSPAAALAAQAVLARTWALANRHRFRVDGYHLCSDTQCQVYSDPRQASQPVRQAIAATSGQVLSTQGQPINAVYHASNGGVMAAGAEAWAMAPVSYLQAGVDGSAAWRDRVELPLHTNVAVRLLLNAREGAHGSGHPRFRWTRNITTNQLAQQVQPLAPNLSQPLQLKVLERGVSGRVVVLEIAGSDPEQSALVLRLDGIRRSLRQLPSTLFVIDQLSPGVWRFSGGGFGHGAGLSQAGAIDLARQGWTTDQILEHYYPGTTYGPLPLSEHSP